MRTSNTSKYWLAGILAGALLLIGCSNEERMMDDSMNDGMTDTKQDRMMKDSGKSMDGSM